MNQTWIQHLTSANARVSDGMVTDFGNPEAELLATNRNGIIADLSHHGLIAAQGADARSFLQGQLTCDVNVVDESHSVLGAWCSPKGRVLTLFRLLEHNDRLLMELPCPHLDSTLSRLRMFVLRAQVELDDVSDRFVRVGLTGEAGANLLRQRFDALPGEPDRVTGERGVRILRLHGEHARFQVFFQDMAQALDFWNTAVVTLTPVGADAWDLLDIVAGVPRVSEQDEFLPQMLNLDQMGGVSFTKGCYVGQEIVARTHHLGRLKRRMFRINFSAETPPAKNTLLYRDGSTQDDESVGRLLAAKPGVGGVYEALAVIKLESTDRPLRLGAIDGVPVEIVPFATAVEGQTG